jgi:hypothetical protein
MKNPCPLLVSPNPVPANASIRVQSAENSFSESQYYITNEAGGLVRKGKIADPNREFSLSVGGMPDGTYWLVMGEYRERFTIV